MPNKRPPNAEATQFRSGEEAVENGRKGGVNSGIARREKKATQKILQDLLNLDVESNPLLVKLAKQVGVSADKSIHELATTVLLINTLKKGDLSDLGQLQKLLGEQTEIADTEAQKQAAFLDAVKKAVTDAD